MVRSRIPAPAIAAETDALPRTDRRAASLAVDAPSTTCPRADASERGRFAFILEVVAPWFGKTVRTVALGAMVALGGCDGQSVELDGVVRDGRSGAPVAGARITTDDGGAAETGAEGSFALSTRPRMDGEGAPQVTLSLVEGGETDTEVRIAVHTPGNDGPITWQHVAGPALDPGRFSVEENGRLLVIRTRTAELGSGRSRPCVGEAPLECGSCHAGAGDHESPLLEEWTAGAHTELGCTGCHDVQAPSALRRYDTATVGGAPFEHLGSGALCVTCHQDGETDIDVAPRSPQADVLLGRGARSTPPRESGPHRFIVDTCVRCHVTRPAADDPLFTRVGGHTFSTRELDGTIAQAACAPCHGEVAPDAIGVRDWDGDGRAGSVGAELARALDAAERRLSARIARLSLLDACPAPHRAAGVTTDGDRLVLTDAGGELLGDCDGDGRFDAGEERLTTQALPAELAHAARDIALLRADGSFGAHNPGYAFGVLRALLQ